MADRFADAGFVFVKFNLSHNGTTIEHPIDFVDLEAFGNNNFAKELDDLGVGQRGGRCPPRARPLQPREGFWALDSSEQRASARAL